MDWLCTGMVKWWWSTDERKGVDDDCDDDEDKEDDCDEGDESPFLGANVVTCWCCDENYCGTVGKVVVCLVVAPLMNADWLTDGLFVRRWLFRHLFLLLLARIHPDEKALVRSGLMMRNLFRKQNNDTIAVALVVDFRFFFLLSLGKKSPRNILNFAQ